MRNALCLLVVLVAGCSLLPDHSLDYRKAGELPRMTLPAGSDARVFTDVYPVPPQTEKPDWTSKSFEAPKPAPLATSGLAQTAAVASDGGQQNVLTRTQDGNGFPALSISGDFSQIWDTLNQVLRGGGVKVDDRNQSLGLYYLELPAQGSKLAPYQLKITRALNAYSLSVQKDDDTLAPTAVASALFDKLQAGWPDASGTNDDQRHSKSRGQQ